jgi:type I restriction enzyme S subunit
VIGKTPRREVSEYWGEGGSWVSISDMKGRVVSETKEEITNRGINECGCKLVTKGTVLLSFKLSIGKVAFAGKDLYTNEAIAALPIKKPNLIQPDYLYYVLRTIPLIGSNKAAKGLTLNKNSLERVKISAPNSIEDQIRIVTVLNKAEVLIAERKESLRLLDELVRSIFLDMFGNPINNKKGWEKTPLSKLGTLDRGVSRHRPRNAPELLGGPYPLIQTGDVANSGLYITSYSQTYSEAGLKQSKLWPKGTLCITIAANIAKTGILAFDACFPDSVVGFVANDTEANPIYVHFLFSFIQAMLEKNAPQAAQKNINLEILRGLSVPKPDVDLQNRFAVLIEKVETLRTHYQASLQELENLYGSLRQRAFRGELDLSRIDAPVQEEPRPLSLEIPSKKEQVKKAEKRVEAVSPIDQPNDLEIALQRIDLNSERPQWIAFILDYVKHRIMAPNLEGRFTYQELRRTTEEYLFDGKPTIRELRDFVLHLLESDPPLLEQVFDYPSSDSSEKQIMFRLIDENKKS